MNRTFLYLAVVIALSAHTFAQDFDSDFRICDGLPASQVAFALALAGGDLEKAAISTLNSLPADKLDAAIRKLFHPAPNSLTQLNGRVDDTVTPVQLANQLQMQFNQMVASRLTAATGDNIVCSMSLLSYREASDVFGKRIANQYGVVQVTIRNTDSNHEFLLHQVDFWFGDTLQYYATRDRKIARGVAEKGQAIDPRNLTVRVLEGIGSVAGPITNVFSNDAQLASSIYNSSFIPAVKTVFPDLTVQQIARLDDMGFSAGASTMVIPKNGAISFVAFIPADSFLIPKLAQYQDQLDPTSETGKQLEACSQWQQKQLELAVKPSDGSKSTDADKQAKDICGQVMAPRGNPAVGALSSQSVRKAKGGSTEHGLSSWLTLGMYSKRKNIGAFDAAVVLLLQRDLHILVSGSHIQQLTTQLAVNSVVCSVTGSLVSSSVVTCALGGNNLNLVTQGRLIDKNDSTFSVTSTGLNAGKDNPAQAQLSFPGCPFGTKRTDPFLLEVSTATGAPQINSTEQSFKTAPASLTCSRNADNIKCTLADFSPSTGITLSLSGKDGSSHPLTFTTGAFTGTGVSAGSYTATLQTSDGKSVQLCSPVTVP